MPTNNRSQADLDSVGVKTVVDYYADLMERERQARTTAELAAIRRLTDHEEELKQAGLNRLYNSQKNAQERLEREIADLRARGIEVSHEQALKLAQERVDKENTDKKEAELKLLKQTSAAAQKERDKQNKALDQQLKIEKLKAAGNTQEAKKEQNRADMEALGNRLTAGFDAFKESLSKDGPIAQVTAAVDKSLKQVGKNIEAGLSAINNAISDYAKYQTSINTRLYGASSFHEMVDILDDIAYSPLLNAKELYGNLSTFVNEGIVTNVAQRAMLQTVKDGIVTTFDANESALKRIIRIQQQDSTAARMGLEAYLNRFLNEFIQNTEYLTTTFDSVAESLLEASSLMSTPQSTEFEYIVQKWLGTLVGVGFNESAARNIATAIGQLGSGNLDVFNSNIGTLLTMSAARSASGLSISDMLNQGLDAELVNDLMLSMVQYLQEIAYNSSTNVVKSQLSDIFGVSISDLQAVKNLSERDLKATYDNVMTYNNMFTELTDQFKLLREREGWANLLENAMANFQYQTGLSIANQPILYAMWEITDLIQKLTGGINIPAIYGLGTGIDLETTVENLMKLGIIGVSTLSQIGQIVSGVTTLFDSSILLSALNIAAGGGEVTRGSGLSDYNDSVSGLRRRASGTTTSESIYAGNTDSSSYAESAISGAKDAAQADLEIAKEEAAESDPVVNFYKDNHFVDVITSIAMNTASLYEVVRSISDLQIAQAYDLTAIYRPNTNTVSISSNFSERSSEVEKTFAEAFPVGNSPFEDDEFMNGFRSIVSNLQSLVSDGIKIKTSNFLDTVVTGLTELADSTLHTGE